MCVVGGSQTEQQQKHPEGLLQCRLLGPAPQTAGSVCWQRWGWKACISIKFPRDVDAISPESTLREQLLWNWKKIRLPTRVWFCSVKKIRGQSEAPKCLFSARETTEQRGPRPLSASSFFVSSRSNLTHVWAPQFCTSNLWELTLALAGD